MLKKILNKNNKLFMRKYITSKTFVLLLSILILLIANSIIIFLYEKADISRQIEIILVSIDMRIDELNALEWQSISKQNVNSENSIKVLSAKKDIVAKINKLKNYKQVEIDINKFSKAYDAYIDVLDKEFRLIELKNIKKAVELDEEQVDPKYEELREIIELISADYRKKSEMEIRSSEYSIILTIIFTIFMLSVLYRWLIKIEKVNQQIISEQITLGRSEERYRKLVQFSPDAVLISIDEKCVFINLAGVGLFGADNYTEILGKNMLEFVHPDFKGLIEEKIKDIKDINEGHENSKLEIKITRIDGRVIDVEVSAIPFFYQEKLGVQIIARDISERKRAEEAIKYAYSELDQIINTSVDGMRVVDRDFNVIRVNESISILTGICNSEAIGKKCYETFRGPLCHTPSCPLTRILNGEEYFECDVDKSRNDGVVIPCIVTATPFRDSRDQIIGIVENFKDISERKIMEESLIEQKVFTESLIQNAMIPVFVLNSKGKVIIWNKSMEEYSGVKAAELIGTDNHWKPFYEHKRPTLADLIIDGNQVKLDEYYKNYTNSSIITEGIHGEDWFNNINGKRKYILIDAAPIYNSKGELVAVVETTRDITDRKLAEEKLRDSEQVLQATFEQAAVGIVHADLDGRWVFVNQKFCDIIGYSKDEAINLKFKDITYPDDIEADLKHVSSLLNEEIKTFSMEKRYIRKDGSIIWVNLTASLVRDLSGEPKYFIGIIEDINERKLNEELIKKYNLRIQNELLLASKIQSSLFPMLSPEVPGICVAASSTAANEVGGDYCDLFNLKGNKLGIAIGDVMGKGIPAALFVAITYAIIRNLAFKIDKTDNLVNEYNREIYSQLEFSGQFVTFFYSIYDKNTRELKYTNAGHNQPIIYRAKTGEVEIADIRSYVIGGRREARYKEGKVNLDVGDIVFFYTDGLKEGRNNSKEQFGLERIKDILRKNYIYDSASINDIMYKEFNEFLSGEPLYDDVTMVTFKVTEGRTE